MRSRQETAQGIPRTRAFFGKPKRTPFFDARNSARSEGLEKAKLRVGELDNIDAVGRRRVPSYSRAFRRIRWHLSGLLPRGSMLPQEFRDLRVATALGPCERRGPWFLTRQTGWCTA